MTQYAYFRSADPAPSPVIGWYDTGEFAYASLPAADDLLEVTAEQWTGHFANPSGWAVSNGALVTYTPAPQTPTLAQQAQALLAAGCAITSTSTPALDSTYATDATSQQHVQAEITSILLNGTFADGTTSIAWLDASNVAHTFTIAEFKALATALAAFVSACLKVVNGQATVLPSQPSVLA